MNYNINTGKLYYKAADVISSTTGEVIHQFTGADLLRGKQYWRAWCVGNFYRIVDEAEEDSLLGLYSEDEPEYEGKTYSIFVR